jgi:hypothetical protein
MTEFAATRSEALLADDDATRFGLGALVSPLVGIGRAKRIAPTPHFGANTDAADFIAWIGTVTGFRG